MANNKGQTYKMSFSVVNKLILEGGVQLLVLMNMT